MERRYSEQMQILASRWCVPIYRAGRAESLNQKGPANHRLRVLCIASRSGVVQVGSPKVGPSTAHPSEKPPQLCKVREGTLKLDKGACLL